MRALTTLLLLVFHITYAQKGYFVKNKGQWQSPILSKIDLVNGSLFLEEKTLTFNFVDATFFNHKHSHAKVSDSIDAHAYRWHFVKANKPTIQHHRPQKGVVNYFK